MDRSRTRALAALAAALVIAAASTTIAAPEHERLKALCGIWDVELTFWFHVETGTYDEAAKQFELKADYPLAAETWHQRTVIQPTSADTMTAVSYLSFGTVPEWKGAEIKYTRLAK
jgi:hypothetical protein